MTGISDIAPEDLDGQLAELFGLDVYFDVTADDGGCVLNASGELVEISKIRALLQSVRHMIITNPGDVATLPDYGAGARLFVKALMTRAAIDELTARVRTQLLRDDRIASVTSVEVTRTDDGVLRIKPVFVPVGLTQRNEPLVATVEVS
jgi:phage baseplate assembly protein W